MGTAAKHLDPIVGIDMHMVQPPPPAPPVMMPIPVAGYLVDPNDYGTCKVRVNGFPPARAGTPGIACPPHIPPGGMFVKPPTGECEMFQGSSTVVFAGDAAASQGNPVLTCHDVGMPAPSRPWRKVPTKSLMMAGANVIPIPGPSLVMIAGAPTISATASSSEATRDEESVLESVEFEAFDSFGEPLANGTFELQLPNGDVEEGEFDDRGRAKVDDVPRGYSLLVVPAFEDPDAAPKPVPRQRTAPDDPDAACEPAGTSGGAGISHVVVQGESIRTIARRYGVADWKTLYEHPDNAELKRARPDPNVLYPGDVVTVPREPSAIEYRLGGVPVRSSERTKVYADPKVQLRIVPTDGIGRPYVGMRFRLVVGASCIEGRTSDGGVIDAIVSGSEAEGRLTMWMSDSTTEEDGVHTRIRIDALDPTHTPSGLATRLAALGYHVSKSLDPKSLEATLRRFQADRGLSPSGVVDDSTAALLEAAAE